MAGLLDGGPTALEILTAKRNQVFADLQEQLRQSAASRTNAPVLAGGMTDLGSAIGRALAGRVGGGEDSEMAEAIARDKKNLEIATALGSATSMKEIRDMVPSITEEYGMDAANALLLHGSRMFPAAEQPAAVSVKEADREVIARKLDKMGAEYDTENLDNISYKAKEMYNSLRAAGQNVSYIDVANQVIGSSITEEPGTLWGTNKVVDTSGWGQPQMEQQPQQPAQKATESGIPFTVSVTTN
jgi:hypothetical protein